MQIDRLFTIVQILVNHGTTTAGTLADKFGVSTRTIYRDIDTLSLNGVPVYTTKGKGGGIHILEDYVMDKSVLSDEEQSSLIMGLEALQVTKASSVDDTLDKLRSLFKRKRPPLIQVDFAGWNDRDEEKKTFEAIKTALVAKKMLSMVYYNTRGEKSSRKVVPLQLIFKVRHWYLSAYCLNKKGHRLFKVSRIRGLALLEEQFEDDAYSLPEYSQPTTRMARSYMIECRFRINSKMFTRVYDEFPPESIEKDNEGNFIVTYVCPEDEWLYSFILSYGHHLQVIEPEYLKTTIKEKIRLSYVNAFEKD